MCAKENKFSTSINRYRGQGIESDVIVLDFLLNMDDIPDDLIISDIFIDGNRHLIFDLSLTLEYHTFKDVITLYIDGTFS